MVPLHSALQGLRMSGLHCSQVAVNAERDRISSKAMPWAIIHLFWSIGGGATRLTLVAPPPPHPLCGELATKMATPSQGSAIPAARTRTQKEVSCKGCIYARTLEHSQLQLCSAPGHGCARMSRLETQLPFIFEL